MLFDPMLKLFAEREKRIDGAKLEARKIDEKSGEALTKYDTEMGKARALANLERDKIRAEADLRNHCSLQITVAIDTHRIGVHRPAVRNPRDRWRHI